MARNETWFQAVADRLETIVRARDPAPQKIVCASGISPSGAIHLGNLREVMTTHLVAEELRKRGWTVDHVHSWDDFDRFRKVPHGVPEEFAEHVGRPLSAVPDPLGELPSYADRHISVFEACLRRIGVPIRAIRQSRAYVAGTYREPIKLAMARRLQIFDILAEFQTPGRHAEPEELRRAEYYPFKVYCHECGKDSTRVTAYDEASALVTYVCDCGHSRSFSLDDEVPGKLVWKVDWPMRWAYEGVTFEPGGEDHSAPGSSFTVGKRVVREIFGGAPPEYVGYAFVGVAGESKISSSAGTSALPGVALEILEPCILRWLYSRRNCSQPFTIDFGQEVLRVYDEWDRLGEQVRSSSAGEADRAVHETCVRTSAGEVTKTAVPVPFRVFSSAADITNGNLEQILRIAAHHLGEARDAHLRREECEPRLSCAIAWITRFVPDEERTRIRPGFDAATWESLGAVQREAIGMVLGLLDEHWSLEGLTSVVYGVPKLMAGLPMDAPPNPEIKRAQRELFVAIYMLITGNDTGPRIPTLFLSLGQERVRSLLSPSGAKHARGAVKG